MKTLKQIYIIGDSITLGFVPLKNKFLDKKNIWVNQLKQNLNLKITINAKLGRSISPSNFDLTFKQDSALELLKNFQQKDWRDTLFLIYLGINDFLIINANNQNSNLKTNVEIEIANRINILYKKLLCLSDNILFIIPHQINSIEGKYFQLSKLFFNQLISSIKYINCNNCVISDKEDYKYNDGIHLNIKQHHQIGFMVNDYLNNWTFK